MPLSTKSKGLSVNSILARRKESFQQKALGPKKRVGPERSELSVNRARNGIMTAHKFNEVDIPDIPEIRHG